MPQVAFGGDYESFKLTFLIACAFDEELRVMAQVGKLFGGNRRDIRRAPQR